MRTFWFNLMRLLVLFALAGLASAHTLQLTGVTVRIEGNSTEVNVVAHVPLLLGKDPAVNIPQRLQLQLDGQPFRPGSSATLKSDPLSDTVSWTAREARAAGAVVVSAPLFPDRPEDTTVVLVYRNGQLIDRSALNPAHPSAVIGETVFEVMRRFVQMGIFHILSGPDHILFVVGLILVGGAARRLLGVITAFTLAHSLTVSLTALGMTSLSPRLVEPMIALSIVVVGLENLLRRKANFEVRAWLAFGFGFFHGFGFAGALAEVGLPKQAIGWSLASFNIGVELGQAFIVLLALPLLGVIRRKSERVGDLVTQGTSALIVGAGAVWFVARILG